MPLCLKLSVVPPLQKIRSVNVREPLMPSDGPLPAPMSIANHPLLISRRPDRMKFPAPFPFCDDKLPDMEIVSRVVIGASMDCDMDIPDTSITGKGMWSSSLQGKNEMFSAIFKVIAKRQTYSNSSWYESKMSVALTLIVIFPRGLVRCCSRRSSRSRAKRSYSSLISFGVFVRWTISHPSVSSPFTPKAS